MKFKGKIVKKPFSFFLTLDVFSSFELNATITVEDNNFFPFTAALYNSIDDNRKLYPQPFLPKRNTTW